jgi:hypothetical protein
LPSPPSSSPLLGRFDRYLPFAFLSTFSSLRSWNTCSRVGNGAAEGDSDRVSGKKSRAPSTTTTTFVPSSPGSQIAALTLASLFPRSQLGDMRDFGRGEHPKIEGNALFCCLRRRWQFPPSPSHPSGAQTMATVTLTPTTTRWRLIPAPRYTSRMLYVCRAVTVVPHNRRECSFLPPPPLAISPFPPSHPSEAPTMATATLTPTTTRWRLIPAPRYTSRMLYVCRAVTVVPHDRRECSFLPPPPLAISPFPLTSIRSADDGNGNADAYDSALALDSRSLLHLVNALRLSCGDRCSPRE